MSTSQRWFDGIGAAGGLIVFAPIMAVVAAAIWWDDRGPVLFRQARVGYDRRTFMILKFRSMRDGRITRVGRILRATGLDELPQFFNILRGDMSAVGPRPLTEEDVRRLGWTGTDYDFRWQANPGLTGLAQLAGTDSQKAASDLDRAYLEHRSLALDCRLIAWSFAINVFGKVRVRAYLRSSGTIDRFRSRAA